MSFDCKCTLYFLLRQGLRELHREGRGAAGGARGGQRGPADDAADALARHRPHGAGQGRQGRRQALHTGKKEQAGRSLRMRSNFFCFYFDYTI